MAFDTIISLVSLAIGVAGLVWFIGLIFRARATEQWPRTVATIELSWVRADEGSEGTKIYEPNVLYRYYLDGREIVAHRIRMGGVFGFSWRGPADSLVRRYPKGAGVTIAYNPDKLDEAVLEPGSTRTAWGGVALSLAWIALCVAFLSAVGDQ